MENLCLDESMTAFLAEILTRWSSWVFVPRLSSSCCLQWVWWNQLITWVALQARVSFVGRWS